MMQEDFSLKDFQQYSATKPDKVLSSRDPEGNKHWARRASFLQLSFTLELFRMDHSITPEQSDAIDTYNQYITSDEFKNRPLTEPRDIEAALTVLEKLGIDVSQQRQQLTSWPASKPQPFH
jgi:hypothetical protein